MAANGGTSGCGTTGVMFGVAFVVGSRSAGNDSGSGSCTSHDYRIVMLGCIKAFFLVYRECVHASSLKCMKMIPKIIIAA